MFNQLWKVYYTIVDRGPVPRAQKLPESLNMRYAAWLPLRCMPLRCLLVALIALPAVRGLIPTPTRDILVVARGGVEAPSEVRAVAQW